MPVIVSVRRKGGTGSGNWGHKGRPGMVGGSASTGTSSAAFNPATANRKDMEKHGYIAVFRGTGSAGMQNIRPSSEGVVGPGIYFYDNPEQARTYAEPGGGIITGFVHKDSAQIVDIPRRAFTSAHKVLVVPDVGSFIRRGSLRTEDTSGDLWKADEYANFYRKIDSALNEV